MKHLALAALILAAAAPLAEAGPRATKTKIVSFSARADADLSWYVGERGEIQLVVAPGEGDGIQAFELRPFDDYQVFEMLPDSKKRFFRANKQIKRKHVLLTAESCTEACSVKVVVHEGDELVVYDGLDDQRASVEMRIPLPEGASRFRVNPALGYH